MKHNLIQHWWSRLTGAQHILSTMVADYRRTGIVLEILGQQYRVTHIDDVDIWGRRVWWRSRNAIIVESPVKRRLYSVSAKRVV